MNFTLGTAQLGMNYGVVNRSGKPSRSLAVEIVRRAAAEGVTSFDTARSYGDAEEVLGEALGQARVHPQVVTKLDPFTSLASDATTHCVRAAVDKSVARSCEALRTDKLQVLLLHGWEHYGARDGAIWQRLLELRAEGRVAALGASIYEPSQALEALQVPDIRHLQLPMNILDWRWKVAGVDRAFAQRPDVTVHGRSAFLQGTLAQPTMQWPAVYGFDTSSCTQLLTRLAQRFQRESVLDLCIAYVRAQSWITSVVVGCETLAQLEEDLRLFRLPKLPVDQCEELEKALPPAPEDLLNPARWKIA